MKNEAAHGTALSPPRMKNETAHVPRAMKRAALRRMKRLRA